jgi:hypothetical protein
MVSDEIVLQMVSLAMSANWVLSHYSRSIYYFVDSILGRIEHTLVFIDIIVGLIRFNMRVPYRLFNKRVLIILYYYSNILSID